MEINEVIGILPQILIYYIPGRIALALFNWLTDYAKEASKDMLISCSCSFVGLAVATLLVETRTKTASIWCLIIVSTLLLLIGALSWGCLIRTRSFNSIVEKTLHRTIHDDIILGAIDLQHGTTVRVFGKDGYHYTGSIRAYDQDWLLISGFSRYLLRTGEEVSSNANNNDCYIMLKFSDIESVEFYN